jgi:hypothetical protein
MGKARITTIATTKIATRIAVFDGLDLMDAALQKPMARCNRSI